MKKQELFSWVEITPKNEKQTIAGLEDKKTYLFTIKGKFQADYYTGDFIKRFYSIGDKIQLPFVPPVNQNSEFKQDLSIGRPIDFHFPAPVNKEITVTDEMIEDFVFNFEIKDKDINDSTMLIHIHNAAMIEGMEQMRSQLLSPTPSIEGEEAVKVFTHLELPEKSKEDPTLSVDVIIKLEDMLNIGFFDSKEGLWVFHTDTLVEPNGKPFTWVYAPEF